MCALYDSPLSVVAAASLASIATTNKIPKRAQAKP